MSKKEKNSKNGFIYLLVLLFLFLGVYTYKKHSDYNELQAVFKQEKSELESELDELITDYKDLTVTKKDLSKRLIREMNKIIALKDSVKGLKASNYRLIRKYRKKVVILERENRDLFAKVDSLNIVNAYLKSQNLEVVKKLEDKETVAKQLEEANKELTKTKDALAAKVAVAGELKTDNINVVVMKERISGKLTTTSRSSRADAFRVTFKVLKNKVTTSGEKDIYVQITDDKNNVIASKGVVKLKNNKKIEYSDKLTADYRNEELDVLSLILVSRDNISKGIYNANIFVDGRYEGKSSVKLR